MIFLEPRRRHP
jgi:hypothetical protein